jgi:hypothetical protein
MKTITISCKNEGWQNISRKDIDDNLGFMQQLGAILINKK